MSELSAKGKQGPPPGAPRRIVWGRRSLELGPRALVMGVINCTPDSFYPGSRADSVEQAVRRAVEMAAAGADILDIGGESSRPGSEPVPEAEELERVIPVIETLRARIDVPVSIDTRRSEVAAQALDAGADLVNDISALRGDPSLAALVAERRVPVVLMHMRGEPRTMQESPYYRDTVAEILEELRAAVGRAEKAGIPRDLVIVDPGIGFGKRLEDNLRLLRHLGELRVLGCPVMIGLSRKAFIGAILDVPVEERLLGTVVANTIAVLNGADIVRVHDVPAAVAMARVIDAVRRVDSQGGAG
jgi:dihydropteroate synthase